MGSTFAAHMAEVYAEIRMDHRAISTVSSITGAYR